MALQKKYAVGERVLLYTETETAAGRDIQWVAGEVVFTDYRMVMVQCECPVYDTLGGYHPDGRLWCTHGSKRLRRECSSE